VMHLITKKMYIQEEKWFWPCKKRREQLAVKFLDSFSIVYCL
jgi:hypothetical protein